MVSAVRKEDHAGKEAPVRPWLSGAHLISIGLSRIYSL